MTKTMRLFVAAWLVLGLATATAAVSLTLTASPALSKDKRANSDG